MKFRPIGITAALVLEAAAAVVLPYGAFKKKERRLLTDRIAVSMAIVGTCIGSLIFARGIKKELRDHRLASQQAAETAFRQGRDSR